MLLFLLILVCWLLAFWLELLTVGLLLISITLVATLVVWETLGELVTGLVCLGIRARLIVLLKVRIVVIVGIVVLFRRRQIWLIIVCGVVCGV